MPRKSSEITRAEVASTAAKILCSPFSNKAAKSAAALTLRPNRQTSRKNSAEVARRKATSVAAKILRSPHSSPTAKKAAVSALTQRPDKA